MHTCGEVVPVARSTDRSLRRLGWARSTIGSATAARAGEGQRRRFSGVFQGRRSPAAGDLTMRQLE